MPNYLVTKFVQANYLAKIYQINILAYNQILKNQESM